jgi:hypothetical protein
MARMYDHLFHLITPSALKLRDFFELQHDSFLACIACGLSLFLLICSCNHACFELSGFFFGVRICVYPCACAYGDLCLLQYQKLALLMQKEKATLT